MKLLKKISFALLTGFLFCFSFISCSTKEDEPEPVTVKKVTLNTDDVKLDYKSGEDAFTTDGLVVNVEYTDRTKKTFILGDENSNQPKEGEFLISGFEDYADEDGILSITSGLSQTVTIFVKIGGKRTSYDITINRDVKYLKVELGENAATTYFTGDTIRLGTNSGFTVKAFFIAEGEEGSEEEEGEEVKEGFTYYDVTDAENPVEVSSSLSGVRKIKASFMEAESAEFELRIYEVKGIFETDFEPGADVPSLEGIKVYLGEKEIESASVKYFKGDAEYTASTFEKGTYSIKVNFTDNGKTLEKTLKTFSVVDKGTFKILADGSGISANIMTVKIDATDMNIVWTDVEGVHPDVELTEGTSAAWIMQMFISPELDDSGKVKTFIFQMRLGSTGLENTVATFTATIKDTLYTGVARFKDAKCIDPDYIPSKISLNKTDVELQPGKTSQFSVTDNKYGLDYSSEVEWTIEGNDNGCSIDSDGLFRAASLAEDAEPVTVTVRATLKADSNVYVETNVTVDPGAVDISKIYDFNMFNKTNNGAWFTGEVTWEDEKYAVKEISSKTANVQQIVGLSVDGTKATFEIDFYSANCRGTTATIVYRVKTVGNELFDVSVTYKDSVVTNAGSDTEILGVVIDRATLNPKLLLSKDSVNLEKDASFVIDITPDEFESFDASKLNVSVSNTSAVKAELNGTKLTLTWLDGGTSTVTVSYEGTDVSASVSVTTMDKDFAYKVLNITGETGIVGASLEIHWTNSFAVNPTIESLVIVFNATSDAYKGMNGEHGMQGTNWIRTDALNVVMAGCAIDPGVDSTAEHNVTIILNAGGELYRGTARFVGNKYMGD